MPSAEPDPALAVAYSCEILRTSKGFLKGLWGNFEAEAFHRKLPGADPVKALRHMLILALDIVKYAERDGEVVDAEELGEGSYARVFGSGPLLAAKIISDRERPWVHKFAVENSLLADRLGLGPRLFGHGRLEQKLGGSFKGTVLLFERLQPVDVDSWPSKETPLLLDLVGRIARAGFHNDLKLPNVLLRAGRPIAIDFDLFSPWCIKVAVTNSCIEHDFRELLEPLGDATAAHFREYYDLFSFSLTLQDGELYQAVLARLLELWGLLEEPVLKPLLDTVGPEKLREVPLEVLVRVPLNGVTVNLLDLRGNRFAHLEGELEGREVRLQTCEHLPQLLCSNGVYWP